MRGRKSKQENRSGKTGVEQLEQENQSGKMEQQNWNGKMEWEN